MFGEFTRNIQALQNRQRMVEQQQQLTQAAAPRILPAQQLGHYQDNHYSKQKETQVIYVQGNTSQIQVSQPSLQLNFTQNSDYQSRDCYYFVNKIRAPSLLENVFPQSVFKMRISELVFINQDDQVPYIVPESLFNETPETTSDYVLPANESMQFSLYKEQQSHYLTSSEITDNIQKQINQIITEISTYVYQPFPQVPVNATEQQRYLFEIFRGSEFQYESITGKIILVTKNKNVRNALKWSGLINLNTGQVNNTIFSEGQLVLSQFKIEYFVDYINPRQNPISYRTARQLGMKLQPVGNYFYHTMISDYSLDTIEYINLFTQNPEVFEALPEGLKNFVDEQTFNLATDYVYGRLAFPYPSNMFYTLSFTIGTNLNTNSWEMLGQKSFRIASFQFDRSGQETATQELRNEDKILHQDSIDSLKNFNLFFNDEFGFELSFIQNVDIEFVIMMKQSTNPVSQVQY